VARSSMKKILPEISAYPAKGSGPPRLLGLRRVRPARTHLLRSSGPATYRNGRQLGSRFWKSRVPDRLDLNSLIFLPKLEKRVSLGGLGRSVNQALTLNKGLIGSNTQGAVGCYTGA
jgi:hypothetical protein